MDMNIKARGLIIECESFTLRVAPGEYQNFPVVDNKGLFPHFRKTDEVFINGFEVYRTDNGPVVGIYKKVSSFAILVCAFSKMEGINTEASVILSSNPSMKKCIEENLCLQEI